MFPLFGGVMRFPSGGVWPCSFNSADELTAEGLTVELIDKLGELRALPSLLRVRH